MNRFRESNRISKGVEMYVHVLMMVSDRGTRLRATSKLSHEPDYDWMTITNDDSKYISVYEALVP